MSMKTKHYLLTWCNREKMMSTYDDVWTIKSQLCDFCAWTQEWFSCVQKRESHISVKVKNTRNIPHCDRSKTVKPVGVLEFLPLCCHWWIWDGIKHGSVSITSNFSPFIPVVFRSHVVTSTPHPIRRRGSDKVFGSVCCTEKCRRLWIHFLFCSVFWLQMHFSTTLPKALTYV